MRKLVDSSPLTADRILDTWLMVHQIFTIEHSNENLKL
jgi:hypothetical protein